MCILGPSLYIRYGSIYIIYPYMLYICNIIHLTSTWSFPAVDVNGRPNPPDLVIMVQRQSVSYALKLCILESEVPEVFCGRTTTRRSFLLGKFPMIQGMKISEFWHGMNYIYITYWGVQLQTAFFFYGKGLCKEKNSQWILGKQKKTVGSPIFTRFTPFHSTWTQSKVPPCWWGRYLDTQQICRFDMPKTPKPQEIFWKFRDFSWNQNMLKISVFFHARQGFSQLCAGKQTCPTRQCPSPRHVYTCKHVPPAPARLFRMLPLVPFNGLQTMINCTCIQLVIKDSNIKTPK